MQRPSWQPPPSSTGNTMSTGALAKVWCFADLKLTLTFAGQNIGLEVSLERLLHVFLKFGLLLQDRLHQRT